MSRQKAEKIPKRAREVLSYFLRNPEAVDSLEGVARWRLLDERVHRDVEEISEALGWLVAHEYLTEQTPRGSSPIFCLRRDVAGKAHQFLRAGDSPAGHVDREE